MKRLAEKLKEVVANVHGGADYVASCSQHLSSGSEEMGRVLPSRRQRRGGLFPRMGNSVTK
jgi:hypothetical protein